MFVQKDCVGSTGTNMQNTMYCKWYQCKCGQHLHTFYNASVLVFDLLKKYPECQEAQDFSCSL